MDTGLDKRGRPTAFAVGMKVRHRDTGTGETQGHGMQVGHRDTGTRQSRGLPDTQGPCLGLPRLGRLGWLETTRATRRSEQTKCAGAVLSALRIHSSLLFGV